jgi:hypothetical protein
MMPTPFVLNDAVVIKQKIIPGQITRAPIPIVTQNQPLLKNHAFSEEGLLKSKRQYQVSKKFAKPPSNNPKGTKKNNNCK